MSVRNELATVLRGEAAAELSPADRLKLENLAATAKGAGDVIQVRDECAGRLRQPGSTSGVEYLLAAACAINGERERALQTLLTLGDRLAQAGAWEPLAAVSERALELEETGAGARLLVRAHEGLKKDPARIDALRRAWSILPDDLELGLLLAVRLGEVGQPGERRTLLSELAPRFAAEGRYAGLEEAALEFVEHEDLEALVRMLRVLPQVVGRGATREARQLLDVSFPALERGGRAGDLEDILRETIQKLAASNTKAAETFRTPLIVALRQGSSKALPDAAVVFATSGLENPEIEIPTAIERYDAVAALPPGRAVLHASFGAGRVRSNDVETVIIDFTRSQNHKMPYAAARRSLTALVEDDLRLLRFTDPKALETLRKQQPGEFLVRALHAMNGEADGQRLKLFLVGNGLVPAGEWTATYRRLKTAAEADSRIDHGRAFEQVYRLASGDSASADHVPLPAVELRKPVKTNLGMMRKFLSQHPGAEGALAQRFGRYVERSMLDDEGDRADRARAGLIFVRWFPDRIAAWTPVLRTLWELGLSVTDLPGEDEQLALLEASHAIGVESDAILSALDSRFSAVRERAMTYRDHLDQAGRDVLRRTLLDHAARYPQAALRLLEEELDPSGTGVAGRGGPSRAPDEGWRLLASALSLIEERPKPSTADKVHEWMDRGGPFERLLETQYCPEEHRLRITVLLRQWRSSDRYLFPALDLAGRVGLGDAVEAVQQNREAKSRKLFDQIGQQVEVELPVMTRATWERLKRELERMERELRTELPKTIQRARELGDLKENAEYHSAKLKQANLSKQVAALQLRLTRARFVDDITPQDGVVGPGTEVRLEGAGGAGTMTYWILGEDEHHHGANVVSFQAAVGRALTGRKIGEEVELEGKKYRVAEVTPKLPAHVPLEEPAP